jgi:hypothetical protein
MLFFQHINELFRVIVNNKKDSAYVAKTEYLS